MRIENNLYHQNCPLCGGIQIEKIGAIQYARQVIFSTNEISLSNKPELYKCSNCNSRFTQYTIPEKTAMELYANGSSGERWKTRPFRETKEEVIVNALLNIFTEGKHVLDIGCNTGELLDLAKENNCITYGIELSTESQKVLHTKGHKVYNDLSEIEDGSLDIITAFDLVEHLYGVMSFLKICKKKLKANGRLIVFTGNVYSRSAKLAKANWWYLKYPEHVIFPSAKFFEISGFEVDEQIATYASIGYKKDLYSTIRALFAGTIKGTYIGLPPFGPDHFMIVLKYK